VTSSAAHASHLVTDAAHLAREAAVAISRVGKRSLGAALVRRAGDDVVLALAFAGELQRGAFDVADAKRSRFVEPERVPVAQRDAWVDPVATGFVAHRTARALPVADLLRAFGVKRVQRRHVCIGAVLVGGFIHASNEAADLVALDDVAAIFTPLVRAHVLLASGTAPAQKPPPSTLTRRQKQIVDLVAQGMTNDQIASRLRLSAETVKTTLHRLYAKLGARNRLGLVRAVAGAPLT
jgi:DNA-binding CsgD family transcriptional regulator